MNKKEDLLELINNAWSDIYCVLQVPKKKRESIMSKLPPQTDSIIEEEVWTFLIACGYAIAGDTGQGQDATWIPWSTDNPNVSVTQWGFLRSWALQAWNEYNWNGLPAGSGMPEYQSFLYSFTNIKSFIDSTNSVILAMKNSQNFQSGTFSNVNDLSSGDISGVWHR